MIIQNYFIKIIFNYNKSLNNDINNNNIINYIFNNLNVSKNKNNYLNYYIDSNNIKNKEVNNSYHNI